MTDDVTHPGHQLRLALARWASAEAGEQQLAHTDHRDAEHINTTTSLYDKVWELVDSSAVTRFDVVQAIASLFTSGSPWPYKKALLVFMETLLSLKEPGHVEQRYPEFFWIVLNTNILFEVDDVSDIAKISGLLRSTGGAEVLRAYLLVTLLTGDTTRLANAIKAFYPVGHTIHTLTAVDGIVEDARDANLRHTLYQHALLLIGRDKPLPFSIEDINYLRAFFTRGLAEADLTVRDICQEALKRLA